MTTCKLTCVICTSTSNVGSIPPPLLQCGRAILFDDDEWIQMQEIDRQGGKPEISCGELVCEGKQGDLKKFCGKLINLFIRTRGNEPEAGLIGNGPRNFCFRLRKRLGWSVIDEVVIANREFVITCKRLDYYLRNCDHSWILICQVVCLTVGRI